MPQSLSKLYISEVEAVAEYIDHQEEQRKFLQAYAVDYGERYVWD